jgi:diguanylate cyclase (GGDEF)-like protein
VDREIKEYADTLYLDALMESSETVRKDRVAQAHKRALLPTHLPISGVDIQNVARIYEAHVERCMDARLRSYQSAYADTARTPSEEDLSNIIDECKAVWDSEVQKSTKGLKEFVGSHSPVGAPVIENAVQNGSGRGHDRILGKFKIWKAKMQLKPSLAKASEREKQRDVLLPIYNRAEFDLDLPVTISESSEQRPCSLLFLDLDKFKAINDGPGLHDAGDRALKACAGALLRACDGKGTVYRYGGDEFCVLLPNHSLDESSAVANRILREARAIRTEELPNGLSTSIGAACFPESTSDPSKLCSQADQAQRESKDAGGNRVSKADSAKGKNSEVETPKVEKKADIAAPDKRVTEPARDPYAEELKRIAKQVVDFEMTLDGRHVLRHLMIHEPVEVGRTLDPGVPPETTFAQLAIAKQRGLVQHKVEGHSNLRTYWIINPKFRPALQIVLYEGGNN